MPKSGIAVSYGRSTFQSLRILHTGFYSVFTMLPAVNECSFVSVSSPAFVEVIAIFPSQIHWTP
jgi:isoprenylcysteine carboxyl methyltransferase (ICMT) family protein YpbQ